MKKESRGFSRMEITLFPTMLVTELVSQGEGPTSPVGTQHTPTIIESSPYLRNISITYRKTKTKTGRMGIRIPPSNVPSSAADEAITKEMHDRLGRATTTASSFITEQGSDVGLGCHFTMGDSPVQARPERLSNLPNEPSLKEALVTLTKRVNKLEKQLKHKGKRAVIDSSDDAKPSLDAENSPKQGRMIEELDKDENVNLVESTKETARQEPEKCNLEKALELQKQLDERKKDKGDQAHDIDWSDPSVLRYHALQNRPFSKAKVRKNMCTYLKNQGGYKQSYFKRLRYEDIRPIFKRVWDQNHTFVPMDSKIEKEAMKRSRFDLQQESSKKQKLDEQAEFQVDCNQEEDEMKNSGLVQIPYSLTPYVPPTKNDWDMLFQPMFDEYFNSPQSVVSPVPIAAAPRPVNPTGTPLSTSIEQDAPAAITSSTTQETHSPVIFEGVEE
nr:hypothetical protein [Tanacetum cinerariifolium]